MLFTSTGQLVGWADLVFTPANWLVVKIVSEMTYDVLCRTYLYICLSFCLSICLISRFLLFFWVADKFVRASLVNRSINLLLYYPKTKNVDNHIADDTIVSWNNSYIILICTHTTA